MADSQDNTEPDSKAKEAEIEEQQQKVETTEPEEIEKVENKDEKVEETVEEKAIEGKPIEEPLEDLKKVEEAKDDNDDAEETKTKDDDDEEEVVKVDEKQSPQKSPEKINPKKEEAEDDKPEAEAEIKDEKVENNEDIKAEEEAGNEDPTEPDQVPDEEPEAKKSIQDPQAKAVDEVKADEEEVEEVKADEEEVKAEVLKETDVKTEEKSDDVQSRSSCEKEEIDERSLESLPKNNEAPESNSRKVNKVASVGGESTEEEESLAAAKAVPKVSISEVLASKHLNDASKFHLFSELVQDGQMSNKEVVNSVLFLVRSFYYLFIISYSLSDLLLFMGAPSPKKVLLCILFYLLGALCPLWALLSLIWPLFYHKGAQCS